MTVPPPYVPSYPQPTGEPPLWLPYYGCSMVTAVKRFFRKYATFSGRASRAEFWWLYLAYVIVWFALAILAFVAGLPGSTQDIDGTLEPGPGFIPFAVIMVLLMFGSIVPSIALTVRRLHDANFSGLFFLLSFIPYAGSLVVFILTLLPPKPDGARFDRPE